MSSPVSPQASALESPVPGISVVMPVYNGEAFIVHSLPPLVAMRDRGEVLDVYMVDDGSTDGSVALAESLGATVIHSGGRLGPGGARNRAALMARGEILWFVDADVVVHADAAQALRSGFAEEQVVAVFGSYDDKPPAKNFFSQYKNLVHHYYHQRARAEAQTFWSGCGAVRVDAFSAAGGFDVERYQHPSIEDIELGYRLIKAGGQIRLRHDVLCTHLKVWRFWNLVHTEVLRRAIPWSRLIVTSTGLPDDLNTGATEQARAALAGLFFLSILAVLAGFSPVILLPAMLCLVLFANREIAWLFYQRGGLLFALAALLFHQVYYLYSSASFVYVVLEQAALKLIGRRSSRA
ncbi:MAG: glycosyltransferase [Halioglobus sp.]|nr:glycosyltransferase [Halioglobus sp.]